MKKNIVNLDFADPETNEGEYSRFVARYPYGKFGFGFDFIEYNIEDKTLTLYKKMQSEINDFNLCKIGKIKHNPSMDPFLLEEWGECLGVCPRGTSQEIRR